MAMALTKVDSGAATVIAAAKAGELEVARNHMGMSMVDALGDTDPDSPEGGHKVLIQCGYTVICCLQEIRAQRQALEPGAYPDLAPGDRYKLTALDNSDGIELVALGNDPVALGAARLFEAYLNDDYRGFIEILRDTDLDPDTQEPILALILWTVGSQEIALRLEAQLALPAFIH